jgi:hypothetical protein
MLALSQSLVLRLRREFRCLVPQPGGFSVAHHALSFARHQLGRPRHQLGLTRRQLDLRRHEFGERGMLRASVDEDLPDAAAPFPNHFARDPWLRASECMSHIAYFTPVFRASSSVNCVCLLLIFSTRLLYPPVWMILLNWVR